MSVGKGSLKRASAQAKPAAKKVICDNTVLDVAIGSLVFQPVVVSGDFVKSVKTYGAILPVAVVRRGEQLAVVDGVKRVSALKELGVETVKVIVLSGNEKDAERELKKFSAVPASIHEEKFKAVTGGSVEQRTVPVYLL